jgi:DNA-binding response OmpR family regulator
MYQEFRGPGWACRFCASMLESPTRSARSALKSAPLDADRTFRGKPRRAAQGRQDAAILDAVLPGKAGAALAVELRAPHADPPPLIADGRHAEELR